MSEVVFEYIFEIMFTTRLPNATYSPELSAKVSLIDFTVTESGLEDQLLGTLIQKEKSSLQEQRQKLLEDVNFYKKKIKALEDVRTGLAFESARYLRLLQTDNLWKGHMKAMNFVKDFAGLKVYNQQDPLDVYREEGLGLYEKMQAGLRQNSVFSFFAYDPRAQAAAK